MDWKGMLKGVVLQKFTQIVLKELVQRPGGYGLLEEAGDLLAMLEQGGIGDIVLEEYIMTLSPNFRSVVRSSMREIRRMDDQNEPLEVYEPSLEILDRGGSEADYCVEEPDEDETEFDEPLIPADFCEFPRPMRYSHKALAAGLIEFLSTTMSPILDEGGPKIVKELSRRLKESDDTEAEEIGPEHLEEIGVLGTLFEGLGGTGGSVWLCNACLELCEDKLWNSKRLLIHIRHEIEAAEVLKEHSRLHDLILTTQNLDSLIKDGIFRDDVDQLKEELLGRSETDQSFIRHKYVEKFLLKYRQYTMIMMLDAVIEEFNEGKTEFQEMESVSQIHDFLIYSAALQSIDFALQYYNKLYEMFGYDKDDQ